MEMEGVQQSGMAHPPYSAQTVTAPEQQQYQHHQDEPSPEIKLPPVSPVTATGTGAPPLNGAAPPTVQQSEQPQQQPSSSPPAVASPGPRSGTPHSASQPSTPSLHPPRLPLPLAHIAGASLQAAANAAVNAAAHQLNAATHAKAQGQDHLRWRDPITVQYDAGGHPHPLAGKLSNQPSPQLSSVHLPPVVTPTHHHHQQQQHQTPQHQTAGVQFGQSGGYHPPPRASHQPPAIAPLPIALQQQHQHQQQHLQQPPHQNPPQPANSHPPPAHAHPSLHNHILNHNHNQHQHQHQQPTTPHHQFHHHQPPPIVYSSNPTLLPSLPSLPPISLHQPPSLAAHVAPPPIFHTSGGHTTPVHQVVSKPPIMDPPRRASQTAPPPPAGFPSPLQDYARTNTKFVDDCTRLTFAVHQSLPEAVRRTIRDNWQKCLLGSEFHQAFTLNASIHHATSSITQRAVRDFGRKMVTESAEELIKHFTAVDLDSVSDILLEKVSDSFLDKCLAKRLLTIEAKPLVNALATAERLGYDGSDRVILEDRHERVVVQEAFPGAPATSVPVTAQLRSNPPPQGPTSHLQCGLCFRTFPYQAAFDYHSQTKVCSIAPPTSRGFAQLCAPCGQGFDRIEDLAHHTESKVCSTKARPVTQTPVANGYVPSHSRPTPTQPTPTQSQSLPRRAATVAAAGTPSGSPIPSDPYAHLTQDKLDAMNEELQEAEAKYAPRFQEAELIADDKERRAKVEGLRNSFGTKQSMIRKKYGVRLRERRTKAEIAAERERLGIKRQEREQERSFVSASGVEAASSAPRPKQPTAPKPATGSGWTAANTPRADSIWQEHDAKRRRLDNTGEYRTPSNGVDQTTPTRKLLSATELGGGLAGSSATAELHDPTMPPQPTKVYEQSGARVQIHEPATNGHAKEATAPISVDDSSDSSDDEDIPSTLPSRSTPQRKSHLGTATAS